MMMRKICLTALTVAVSCHGVQAGSFQNWKDITKSGSWTNGAMWSSGTAPVINSTNYFHSSSTLSSKTVVTIPAEGVCPISFYRSGYTFIKRQTHEEML